MKIGNKGTGGFGNKGTGSLNLIETTEHTEHTETAPCLSVCSVCFDGERNVACSGNIETLLDYAITDEGGHPAMTNYCFAGLVK